GRRWLTTGLALSLAVLLLALASSTSSGDVVEGDLFTAQIEEGRLPLVVLCIDGADPDDVILPLAANGELPTFARLLDEGTFAPLETLTPTLSPAVWTSLATGKLPAEHGILHFILFDLPLVSTPVSVFPLHTGLNFKVFPRLERLPGVPAMQAPYTSELRRAPAVWEIAGVHAPVGSYRWRVTWPVEELNGFAVASDVSLLDQMPGFSESGVDTRERRVWPEDAFRGTQSLRRERPEPREVAEYVTTPEDEIDLEDPLLRPVLSAYNRILPVRLTELIAKYRPALTLAGYHSVDGFSHRYWKEKRSGGRFSPAIEQRYRFVDEELGTTLAALEESLGVFNLIIVSDHGFDFSEGHHTHAPDGIFFGRGPAFEAGRRMDRLHVLDIAPLMLDLVGLPVADDMPGAEPIDGEPPFRAALSEEQRANHALRRTPSYGRRELRALSDTPFEEETLQKLRSLGYID
ncbi:MAG: alkaline phosphatase family protein, partial [Acidobacteriota bacterium]